MGSGEITAREGGGEGFIMQITSSPLGWCWGLGTEKAYQTIPDGPGQTTFPGGVETANSLGISPDFVTWLK